MIGVPTGKKKRSTAYKAEREIRGRYRGIDDSKSRNGAMGRDEDQGEGGEEERDEVAY